MPTEKQIHDLKNKMHHVVENWWVKSGEIWASKYQIAYTPTCGSHNKPYEAMATLLGDPHTHKDDRMWIVNIHCERIARLVEAIRANPDALLKLLEIQYEEAHRKDNQ